MRRGFFRLNVRGKLMLAFVGVLLPAIPLIAWLTLDQTTALDVERQRRLVEGMRDSATYALDAHLELLRLTPVLVAQTPYLHEYVRVRSALRNPFAAFGEGLLPVTADGLETGRELVESSLLSYFRNSGGAREGYRSIALIGPEGHEWIAVADGEPVGSEDLRDRSGAPFLAGRGDGSDPLYQAVVFEENEPVLLLALPLTPGAVGRELDASAAASEFLQARPQGTVVVEYRLSPLAMLLRNIRVGDTDSSFVWDRELKTFVVPPARVWRGGDQPETVLLEPVRRLLSQYRFATHEVRIGDEPFRLSFRPADHYPFTVGTLVSVEELSQAQVETARYVIFISLAVFCALLVVVLFVANRLAAPIAKFAEAADRLAEGDFDTRVRVRSRDEVGRLARSFNTMADRLGEYVRELADKHRIENELVIAQRIQSDLLPRTMPELPGVDVYGLTAPARQVGGDYFDFFNPTPDSVGIAMGDVTGKGIPAALLMSATRSVLRSQVAGKEMPDEVLKAVNALLLPDVSHSRNFVALSYSIYCPRSRNLTFSNAGQVFPMHYRQRTGECGFLECSGLPLGARPQGSYQAIACRLEPGDLVLFYTDGCVESANAEREIYGFRRLMDALSERAGLSARAVAEGLLDDINRFMSGHEPYDDITLAVLKVGNISPSRD